MDRENKKRAREEAEDKKAFTVKTAKKQDVSDRSCFSFTQVMEGQDETEFNNNSNNNNNNNNNLSSSSSSSDNNNGLGVFDFPWLHNEEGMISNKSEEWNFQDTFSSSLDDPACTGLGLLPSSSSSSLLLSSQVELSRQCLYETETETITTTTPMMNFPEINKFEDNVWPFFKGDQQEDHDDDQLGIGNVDCIWSSLINQPLQ